MLMISNEQMEVLENSMGERFVEKMRFHLKDVFADVLKEKSDLEIETLIRDGIDKASGYDIAEEQAVALFIDLTVHMGPDFEKRENNGWIASLLERADMTGREKMDFVYTRLMD